MTVICRVAATTTGNSGLPCAIDARTTRRNPYPDDSEPEPRFLLRVVAVSDASAEDALFARGFPRVQQVGVRIYKGGSLTGANGFNEIEDGTRIDRDISAWQVSTSIETTIQKATITAPLDHRGRSPLGSPLAYGAPVPGITPVHILLAYKLGETAADRFRQFPIFAYGLADDTARDGNVSDQYAFGSNMARYVDTPATIRYPAGHGLSYAFMIQAICNFFPYGYLLSPDLPQYVIPGLISGVPVFNNFQDAADDIPMRKPVTLERGDWLSLAKAIGVPLGIKLYENLYGLLEGCFVRPELGPPTRVEGLIGEADIVRSVNGSSIPAPRVGVSPTAPTYIRLSGSRQVTRPDGSTHKVINLSSESRADVALAVEPFLQQSLGTTVPTGFSSSVFEQITSQSETTIEKDGSTVVSQLVVTDSLLNPTRARYQLDVDLSILNYVVAYIDEDTDNAQARQFTSERLTLSSKSTFSKTFNTTSGYLSKVMRETYGYKHVRAYLQMRPNQATSWEDLVNAPGAFGRYSLGTGEGVKTLDAEYQLTDRVIEEYINTDDGFVAEKTTYTYGFRLSQGWKYRYGDDTKSNDAEETFGLISKWVQKWKTIDDLTTAYSSELRDADGVRIRDDEKNVNSVILDQPPQSEQMDDAAPKRSDYQTDGEFALAMAASQFEQQEMHAIADGSALLNVRPYRELAYSDSWCQESWQLKRLGERLILMASARPVTWTMLPNPLIRKGQWWHVRDRLPGVDLDHDVQITGVDFAPDNGAILMRMTGLTWD